MTRLEAAVRGLRLQQVLVIMSCLLSFVSATTFQQRAPAGICLLFLFACVVLPYYVVNKDEYKDLQAARCTTVCQTVRWQMLQQALHTASRTGLTRPILL